MSETVMKLKNTNYLAIALLLLVTIWQGFKLYESQIIGEDLNTYIYGKVIYKVIPGVRVNKPEGEVNIVSKLIHGLTEVDINNKRTLIEKNITFLNRDMILASGDDYGMLKGLKGDSAPVDEDYFDPKDEIKISDFQNFLESNETIDISKLESDSYVTSKLINFDANLNYKNQAMKKIDIPSLYKKEFKIDNKVQGPKVLIFHTHPKERFAGEEPSGGGVVDLGNYLKEILETQYGVETMHCTSRFEKTAENSKKDDYGRMQIEVKKILEENPSIEIAIDIHRDGVGGSNKFLTNIEGKDTARLMFVNGFCHVQKNGQLTPIESLPNPYVEDNMALALQMQLRAMEKYPGFIRKTLVKPYRYSLHMKPMSMLIEVGNENNTKEEALNTMEIVAELLMEVIKKD